MAKLSDDRIKEIQNAYAEIGTYSGVAKKLGCSAATVKKYTQGPAETAAPAPKVQFIFNKEVTPVENIIWTNIENLGRLTDKEYEEIKELWNEI